MLNILVCITILLLAGLFIAAIIKAIWFDPEHGAFMVRVFIKNLDITNYAWDSKY